MDPFEVVRKDLLARKDLKKGTGAGQQELKQLSLLWPQLPLDYLSYLKSFGWVEFEHWTFWGLGPGVPPELDLLAQAPRMWNGIIPKSLFPFFESGGDWYYCFDGEKANRVVCWSFDEEYGSDPDAVTWPSWSDWYQDYVMRPS